MGAIGLYVATLGARMDANPRIDALA